MKSLNIVAHPDDDLLFLNPHIALDMQAGHDVYIVYLTMGDDGNDAGYVNLRMQAIHNAYNVMLNGGHANFFMFPVRSSSYRNGDKEGDLYRLYRKPIYETRSVGDWSPFTLLSYAETLRNIAIEFKPNVIRIQDSDADYSIEPTILPVDHVDHVFGALIAEEALSSLGIPIESYRAYNIRDEPPNLDPHCIELKTRMWRAYQEIDTSVAGEIWDDALSRCYQRQI